MADSQQTLLCTYMSAVLMTGPAANSLLWCWRADPIAALAIAGLAVGEGVGAWKGGRCCTAAGSLGGHDHPHGKDGALVIVVIAWRIAPLADRPRRQMIDELCGFAGRLMRHRLEAQAVAQSAPSVAPGRSPSQRLRAHLSGAARGTLYR